MPTLKQASNRATTKYNAAKPGAPTGGRAKSDFDTGEALDQIETAIGDFIARVIDNIDQATGKTGEPLINTGDITNISAERTDSGWQIKAPPQLDWQSKGISGTERKIPGSPYAFSGSKKSVNLDAIKAWIQSRGIVFEGVSEDSTAFLIGRSIYRKGIDAKNLWEGEVAKLAEDAGQSIADAIAASIANRTTTQDVTIQ
jgi:hypothetical protein